ncbi:thiamine pyrophosphate-dependent dehydrogenase E1 component subunit alpha [Thermanaeromonas sp. C210]|uniref:thiamine pyrophosphate-dependent dehydrogenase E1 component subunit alpha n=1 Tax=Thermanaeromonas sp. C210 TaxID=2731925 RepID=UPI00155D1BE7|nr:thiamine pyrophosphate-dependent dehydrogenase E1 component subunit alpha [Thermanaeromonas sp. C210]GFN24174.1 pyruvate dehydrogenase E1 component subunit alpha [Thermanaeromonas sp. C210]
MRELSVDEVLAMYECMVRIRHFEEKVAEVYAKGIMPGLAHLYTGEEAVATGVCYALEPTDYITSTHRGHGHVIAKGADLGPMMAELFGKETGYCQGKGGSMHIADFEKGILGANGVVGGGIPIATGAGLAIKLRKGKEVVACFFGDGASNQGAFHESLNMAGLWKLPVIYVCENNYYGISVSKKRHQAIDDIAVRAASYGMPGVTVDGNDVLAVRQAAEEAVERARKGEGPTLLVCNTYRWRGHHEGDPNRGARYRSKEEIEEWMAKCPIKRCEEYLRSKGVSDNKFEAIKAAVDKEIEEALKFAESSPYPDESMALRDVYA